MLVKLTKPPALLRNRSYIQERLLSAGISVMRIHSPLSPYISMTKLVERPHDWRKRRTSSVEVQRKKRCCRVTNSGPLGTRRETFYFSSVLSCGVRYRAQSRSRTPRRMTSAAYASTPRFFHCGSGFARPWRRGSSIYWNRWADMLENRSSQSKHGSGGVRPGQMLCI
jgi:hypothetical protein